MRTARTIGWSAAALGLAAAGYGVVVANAWRRYGHPQPAAPDEADALLDRFMPEYEVVERHHMRVEAPADITLASAIDADLQSSPIVQAIFKGRQRLLRGQAAPARPARGIVAETTALGWVVLAEEPGREIVLGAVTRPWEADVVFRGVPPEEFLGWREPDHVKIVWNLRADPLGPRASTFRTETRVTTTDADARRKFRWYWARFSPGIRLIRRSMLGGIRCDAARRASTADA
jgi:hypothetical protein